MRRTLYKYNAETCQYERVRIKTADVIYYVSGLIVMAIAILAGMLVVHDFVIDSEKEIALRKENNALQKNHAVLTGQLDDIESTLDALEAEDNELHSKFFGMQTQSSAKRAKGLTNKKILLADASSFRKTARAINEKSTALLRNSLVTSAYYGEKLSLTRKTAEQIASMPTGLPVEQLTNDNLVSGFGLRVNPFHKGLYDHPGIDIAAPRNTVVLATGHGVVVNVRRSDLQAGYGNFIEIDHGNGFITRYAHLEEVKMRVGQRVKKGMVVGSVGNSGGSIAPHLHYEVVRNGKAIDPMHFMIDGVTSREYSVLKTTSLKQNQSLD